MPRKKATNKNRKIFVLDTSVILHDHNSFLQFDEHDIAIPITVLEELDNFKRGNDTKNFEAREFIRYLDKLSENQSLQNWIQINGPDKGQFKVIMNEQSKEINAVQIFNDNKADHRILNAVLKVKTEEKEAQVILVTKDINLRLKAKALQIQAEDYKTGKIDDPKQLYSGVVEVEGVSPTNINKLYKQNFLLKLPQVKEPVHNHFYLLHGNNNSCLTWFNAERKRFERIEKQYIYGIKPKNAEQTFAVAALMDPEIKLVTIQGVAGTGKTLLSLAAALEQKSQFHQILLARPIVPLSNRDIGFLPGDAEDKVGPYMQPLWDNLAFIKNQFGANEKKNKEIEKMIDENRIVITPLAFIRGRSFSNIIFIVDEAQNLTPHEVKTIITRAGENTKIIFTGDVHQIDTPYLDETSNGLGYIIDRLKGQPLFAHITLQKGERSELANLANEML